MAPVVGRKEVLVVLESMQAEGEALVWRWLRRLRGGAVWPGGLVELSGE